MIHALSKVTIFLTLVLVLFKFVCFKKTSNLYHKCEYIGEKEKEKRERERGGGRERVEGVREREST